METKEFNIVQHFYQAAEKFPDKNAIIQNHQVISFKKLRAEVLETARYFSYQGIQKGDRVLVFVPMSIDLYRIVLALFELGATAVFLDEWVNVKRMEMCCKIASCHAFVGIFKARVLALFSGELRKIPIHLSPKLGYVPSAFQYSKTATQRQDTALITFTTGSTGIPKAAKRTHGFLHKQFEALQRKINPSPEDIDMPILPIVLLINLGTGSTSVIAPFKASKPSSIKPAKIVDQMKMHKVSRLTSSPFVVKSIAQYITHQKINSPNLQKIFTGGAPVFATEASLYQKAFPKTSIEIVFGSTEAEPISAIDAQELVQRSAKNDSVNKGLCVGRPDVSAAVRIIQIIDEPIACSNESKLDQLTLSDDQIGEIIVSGEHVLTEYLDNEEALKRNKIFIQGVCWHRTGDSGYLNQEGLLFLTGRCTQLITKGQKIFSPFVYEELFQSWPQVNIGTVMELKGEVVAIIELVNQSFQKEVKAMVLQLQGIERALFIKKIPRDPRHHSKIEYSRLRARL